MAKSKQREDHIKALYALGESLGGPKAWVSTNCMADHLGVKAPSVTSMVQVLQELGWVEHRPYRGARLTVVGRRLALNLVRKHRLWETFLVERLGFGWEEVHDIAEQLEHIDSVKLVDRLDDYLGRPKIDPHGDPIPDGKGLFSDDRSLRSPSDMVAGDVGRIAAVQRDDAALLSLLKSHGVAMGTEWTHEALQALPHELREQLLVEMVSTMKQGAS
jgi:DtxR family Mn-dependent transcriptional regulator